MVGDVVTVETNATVRKAVRLMNNREIGCLVVVKEGKPAGIVTERDMLKRVLVAGRDPRAMEVGEIMSKPLLSMKPGKRIEEAVKLMFRHKIKKLPVIENACMHAEANEEGDRLILRSCETSTQEVPAHNARRSFNKLPRAKVHVVVGRRVCNSHDN